MSHVFVHAHTCLNPHAGPSDLISKLVEISDSSEKIT